MSIRLSIATGHSSAAPSVGIQGSVPSCHGLARPIPLLSHNKPMDLKRSCPILHTPGPAALVPRQPGGAPRGVVHEHWEGTMLSHCGTPPLLGCWTGSSARDPRGSSRVPSTPPKHLYVHRFAHEPCGQSSISGQHLTYLINPLYRELRRAAGEHLLK